MQELTCFKCNVEMESVNSGVHDEYVNTPYAGTIFRASGQYGSTTFDPLDGATELEITICDSCLKMYRKRTLQVDTSKKPQEYSAWEPYG